MKNVLNTRRAAALLLALVMLAACVPAAVADASDFAGATWCATGFNCVYLDLLDADARALVRSIGSLVQFVPSRDWLTFPSLMSICCTIQFDRNGTFRAEILCSSLGEIDYDTLNTDTGTWSCLGNWLTLSVDGSNLPMTLRDGVLSVSICGFGMDFVRI